MGDAPGETREAMMPTKKTTKKARNVTAATGGATGTAKRKARKQGSSKAGTREASKIATSYALPAAAVLGTSALATAGVIMRERLGEILGAAAAEGVSLVKQLSFAKVLSLVGMERKRSFLSNAIPSLGALVVGLASGAALTFWLAPKLQAAMVDSKPATFDSIAPSPVREGNHEPLRTGQFST
jgi:hypothetical protein